MLLEPSRFCGTAFYFAGFQRVVLFVKNIFKKYWLRHCKYNNPAYLCGIKSHIKFPRALNNLSLTMTRKEETALAQVLSVCADSGLKLSRIARLGNSLISGADVPKKKQLIQVLKMYQETFGTTRLTQSKIDEVVAARRAGEKAMQIARSTGLSLSMVYYIIQGKYAGAPADGHNFPPTGEKRGRPKGSTKRIAL